MTLTYPTTLMSFTNNIQHLHRVAGVEFHNTQVL